MFGYCEHTSFGGLYQSDYNIIQIQFVFFFRWMKFSNENDTRNATKRVIFWETFKDLHGFPPTASLPAGYVVIWRMLALCKTAKGVHSYSRAEACKIAANELRRDWITKNVYPMKEHAVANKI